MLKLFQIGNTPIHFHQQRWHGWEAKGRSKTTEALWSHQFFFQNRQFQPDQQTLKIQSIVVDQAGRTARQQVERLKQLVDFPTTVFAYDLHRAGALNSCACGSYGREDMMWYSNVGILNSVNEDSDSGDYIEVTLAITVNAYWTSLNRYLWSWQGGEFDPLYPPLVTTPYENFIQQYPKIIGEFGSSHWAKRPINKLIAYDPDLWAKQHLSTGLKLETGVGATWGAGNHAYYGDDEEWSAPPLSMYAFKNVPTSGTISIYVQRTKNVYDAVEDLTTINLTQTNTNLLAAGLAALQTTDILYVGDGNPKPGFIVRGGVVIEKVLSVAYPAAWPGQLSPGRNGVRFVLPGSTQAAYLHSNRRM